MSAEKSNIESLFRDALHQAEVPVDPAIWQSVSAGIGSGAAAGTAVSSGLGLGAKIAIGVAVAAGVGTGSWALFAPEDSAEVQVQASDTAPATTSDSEDQTSESPLSSETTADYREFADAAPSTPTETSEVPETSASDTETPPPSAEPASTTEDTPAGLLPESHGSESTQNNAAPSESDRAPEETNPSSPSAPQADPQLDATFELTALHPIQPNYALQAAYDAAESYTWYADGEKLGTGRQLAHTFASSGTLEITLDVTDVAGNVKSHTQFLEVAEVPESSVTPMNVFTRGNDGLNDVYDLREMSEHCTLLKMKVFDLQGRVVFETDDTTKAWNGFDRYGNPCPQGQYVIQYWMAGDDGVMHHDQLPVQLFTP